MIVPSNGDAHGHMPENEYAISAWRLNDAGGIARALKIAR